MNNDEMIWHCIGIDTKKQGGCSFRVKNPIDRRYACVSPYNLTGDCSRFACPLANAQYGTVIERGGKISLHLKTVERAHLPSRLWEQIELPLNREEAFKEIDEWMIGFYDDKYIDLCKVKYRALRKMLRRAREMRLSAKQVRLVRENQKVRRREGARERKALQASRLHLRTEQELVQRLQSGLYGELYDVGEQLLSDEMEDVEREEKLMEEEAFDRESVQFKARKSLSDSVEEEEEEEEEEQQDRKRRRKRKLAI